MPVALIAAAVLCLGGYALARPGATPRRSGWFAYAPLARTTTDSPPPSTGVVVCDRVDGYCTLRAHGRAASSIAVLAPTAITYPVSTVGVPVTITRVRVLETLAGKPMAPVIWLRQIGSGVSSERCLRAVGVPETAI